MAELTGPAGRVFACELKRSRMALVRDTLQRLSMDNTRLLFCDGAILPFSRGFSKILLDAPCSGTGVLHRHPEARWVKTMEDITRLSGLQRTLLEASASLLAPGGTLVYSTCSLEPEENEMQIRSFLDAHREFVLDRPPVSIPANFIDASGFVSITPYDHKIDGMFGARLKKIGEKTAP
jgi:16S rRNA (cytosine967-C5)-methyltransferase